MSFMKKRTIIFVLISVILLCFVSCSTEQKAETNIVVAYINGEAITSRETEFFKTRDRADIINMFSQKYGITDFSDFWDKDFDGTTPSQVLEKTAFEDACEAKIRLILMREKGIYDDISFDALEAKALAYNEEHKGQKNTVGINSIDMSQFYTYYISNGDMELKNILGESELKPTDDEIKAYIAQKDEMSETSAISALVDKKYEDYISDLIKNATIKKAENS